MRSFLWDHFLSYIYIYLLACHTEDRNHVVLTVAPPSCPPASARRRTSFIPDPWPLRPEATLQITRSKFSLSVLAKKLLMYCCHQRETWKKLLSSLESHVIKHAVFLKVDFCGVPVTNDMPPAFFPNIDTARNNIAGFSQMKSQGERILPRPNCMCMFSSILALDFHVVHLSWHTRHTHAHMYFFLSQTPFSSNPSVET